LTGSLEEIASTGGHNLEDVEEGLKIVQSFDPAGVGARDLGECLLIQLKHLDEENSIAAQIVKDHLKQLQNKQYQEIARSLGRPLNTVLAQVKVITRLDPRPGQRYNKPEARLIEPDVFIVKADDAYSVAVNEDDIPQLRLNPTYKKMIGQDGSSKEVRDYVKERYSSAIQFIKNIEQRKQTIIRVCEAIIRRQVEFLDQGIDYLRPMMIKDVAEEVGVHPSTVSRAVANKYAHTPQGVYELRYFFSEAVQGPAGSGIPLITAKRKVKKLIEEEEPSKPLTDEQITKMLNDGGIMVTRRTVAKYREDMKIPSTHQRRVRIKNPELSALDRPDK
jgi:RNA polymerase sigma-54 factor